jgi:hypothetical protein
MKKDKKYLGIWLDHSKAHLIESENKDTKIETLLSGYSKQMRIEGEKPAGIRLGNNRSTNNEYSEHHRKIEMLMHYYKILTDRVKRYDETVLFGPTNAKVELFDLLLKDSKTTHVHLHREDCSRMSEHEMADFVKDYFKNNHQKKANTF